MQKLVWRVKLIADFGDEAAETEVEVARIERDDFAVPETLGLSLAEGKRLTAAIQIEMVRAQAATMGERFRCCAHCGSTLSSKGYRSVTFRSLFGDVPLRVRRFASCQCREIADEARSFSALTLEGGMAPELAYVTAKFAALAPFAKVADLLSELLPLGGAINAGTVRNRIRLGTPATVLCDGDPGLWKLQRRVMPEETPSSTGFTSPCVSSTPCRRRAA
jgi:hypothetical protein